MKQSINVIIQGILLIFLCEICFSDDMDDRAGQLRSSLKIPIKSQSLTTRKTFFLDKSILLVGGFQIKTKNFQKSQKGIISDMDIFDKNGEILARGRVIEGATSEDALALLMKDLVMNSMMIDSLLLKYQICNNKVGEWCIIERKFEKASKSYIEDPSVVHFFREGNAISLYATEKIKDIDGISKAVDALILNARKN
ncbi:MAG: hypothetical protein PHV34_07235 [Verrucomicrobiae bacterium]|nr:hypothetical protein [Verrucomicrobiae bacterium]